jgi:hypothetical protein
MEVDLPFVGKSLMIKVNIFFGLLFFERCLDGPTLNWNTIDIRVATLIDNRFNMDIISLKDNEATILKVDILFF